ncbi:MAG: DUF599 family protein [Betaproteobacteria bacterium]|nr:MAG: DUF599 family protein [Betaproteobacteria bacterium]
MVQPSVVRRFWSLILAGAVLLLILPASGASAASDEAAVTRALAEQGNESAQLLLGLAYLRGGWGLARDPTRASRWLEKAALAGSSYAQDRLADLYEAGLGVPRSEALARDWREKAAHRGNLHAQLKLGEMYLSGKGAPAQAQLARQWLQRAQSGGSDEAARLLAKLDETGASDPDRAKDPLVLLAQRAYPELEWLIARIKRLPYGLDELAHERPVRLDVLAYDGDVEAQYELGRQFEQGRGVARDWRMAAWWYRRAAMLDHPKAIERLVALYDGGGYGLEADKSQARRWQVHLAQLGMSASRTSAGQANGARLDAEAGADLLALLFSAATVAAYYYFLSLKVRADPTFTIHGVNQLARRLWVLSVMQNPSKDVMAVQTLRNFIMGASLMASTATLLIIGTLTLSGQAESISRTWQVLNLHGSHAPEIWVMKVLLLLVTFIIAFFAFAMSVRLANHVLFMLNVPEQAAHDELAPENVANRLNRAGSLFALGMRAYFMAIPLAFWLFGPTFLVFAAVGLVISLYRLDRSRMGASRRQLAVPDE